MKKIFLVVLSLIFMLGLVACEKEVDLEEQNSSEDVAKMENENLNENVAKTEEQTSSEDEMKSMPPTIIAYANWLDNEVAFESDENCLNVDKYVFSDYPRLAVFKFDTQTEFDAFKDKYQNAFATNQSHNGVASFEDATINYDEDFFQNHSLILAYKYAHADSVRYGVSEVKKDNGTLVIAVAKTDIPEEYTDEMPGWFFMTEVEKDYIKECTSFDAQVWE